jgi:hypothetical protein
MLIVRRPRQERHPGPVGHHEAPVGAPVVGLRLGHDPARLRPGPRLIPEAGEDARRNHRARRVVLPGRLPLVVDVCSIKQSLSSLHFALIFT